MPHARPLLLVVALAGSLLSFSGAGSPAGAVTAGSPYIAVTPTRILDTRAGTGAAKAAVAPNGRVVLTVAGGQIPSGVTTVVLNVTVTQPTAGTGYVTVWADQAPRPTASNINFVRGQTVPNLVVAPVSPGGKVDLANGSTGTVQLVADVSGYFAPGSTSVNQGMFGSISPTRVLDTRSGAAVGAGKVVNATVTGQGVPADASAVVVNLTVTQPTAATGDATAYPAGGSRPTASNVNFVRGQTVANLAVVPVGAGGEISLYNHSGGTVQFIADVSGYFLGGAPVDAGGFGALAPARLLDTRKSGGPVAAGATVTVSVPGRAGIPLGNVRAVVLNVTVVQPTRAGVVTVYAGATRPAVSNLNFGAGQTVPNLVVAPVGADGKVQLYNGSIGSVQLIADVSGYVLNQDAPLPDPASKSHYVRNLTGDPTTDAAKMSTAGCSDAQAGATFVQLHIGAQSIT
ncbi:MAG: hypothetical protein QOK11_1809, partial [Pseudonocardiales bacterium]|nr:hypothetical protein [Pseudonocardiales bacterium]